MPKIVIMVLQEMPSLQVPEKGCGLWSPHLPIQNRSLTLLHTVLLHTAHSFGVSFSFYLHFLSPQAETGNFLN